jgi:hypothetical protein
LLDKVIAYVKDKGLNLNVLTNALKFVVYYFPLQLHIPFVGWLWACTRTMKTNDENTYLSLNSSKEHKNLDKITRCFLKKNMKYVNKNANKSLF